MGIKFNASKKTKGETYVVVIGESLNKKHMGIYGYFRNTTPYLSNLDKEGMIFFNNAYSNHTHTIPTLSQALTESNQYNNRKYYNSLSIIEVLKKANIETHWLTNQSIYSIWDNLVSAIGASSDKLVSFNDSIGKQTLTQQFDSVVIDELVKVLKKKSVKNRVIFVHLMGNHGSYKSRYPNEEYTVFSGELNQGEFGEKAPKISTLINEYDNSVLYNDFVVSSLIKALQRKEGVSGFMYLSDHADDVIGGLGHDSNRFTFEMSQIPMIVWFSKDYQKIYSKKYNNLLKRKNKLFSNDMLYSTMIGMFDIKTTRYNNKYDFTSDKYMLHAKDALVLHGRKKYIHKDNYMYWQKENLKYLIDINQENRIFPHRINSIGKLKDIWNDGFRSFEVDVLLVDGIFLVGHHHPKMGVELEKFLNSVDNLKIKRIWLDFKNLNIDNYKIALEKLEYLDKKYNLKNKLILESTTKSNFFNQFRSNGWHTTYYLPTDVIIASMKKDIKEIKNLALKISKQIKLQNIASISFDNRLYAFVKTYLEPIIPIKIVYHIWYSPALYDINFKNKLLKNKMYLDERVKTLLGSYTSQFNL